MVLDLEYATYKKNLESLLADEGKYVLIHGEVIIGTFDTYEGALEAGYGRFGLNPFFVQEIERVEKVLYFNSPFVVWPRSTSP